MTDITQSRFNPTRLGLARRRRGLTKKLLATQVDVQWRSISAFENGEYPPSDETLERITRVVGFPAEFFFGDDLDEPLAEAASFRAMSRMSASKRDAALSAGAIAFALSDWIEKRFELPRQDLLDLRGESPEAAAATLRQYWGLGERPVRNLVHLLEAKGVRVFSLMENSVEVDAFSVWRNFKPFVFLNTQKSAEHSRFDSAHELGHLVLHKHGAPSGQDAEKEANAFASAFLMPSGSVIACAPKLATLGHLIKLKKQWAVSVAAMVYRLHSLNLISDWHYRTLCIEMSELGYRKLEPNPAQREKSQVWEKIFAALRVDGLTKENIAKDLSVPVGEIEGLVFGLALLGLSGANLSNASSARNIAPLRLIK